MPAFWIDHDGVLQRVVLEAGTDPAVFHQKLLTITKSPPDSFICAFMTLDGDLLIPLRVATIDPQQLHGSVFTLVLKKGSGGEQTSYLSEVDYTVIFSRA